MVIKKRIFGKYIALAFLILAIPFSGFAQNLEGIWLTANGEAKIQIYKAGNELYFGKLVGTKIQTAKAKKLWGSLILTNLKKINNTVYKGEAHDPDKEETYSCTITMKTANDMYLRGYIGISLFGRTEHWTRVVK